MGLRQEGVENVMDRDYEPGRPVSRNGSRKSSQEKSYRNSGDRGLNGSRPVPLEKPLSLIINRNDSFENGHYSTPKGSYNHLLAEEFTKKALDVVHGHSSTSTPVSSVVNSGPSTSSSAHNPSFTSPAKIGPRQESTMKRRNVVEKIEKLRDGNKMETFISQLELSTPNQICLNVRRYARYDNPNVPEKMRHFILEGSDTPMTSNKKTNVPVPPSKRARTEDDGDATDYDDLEEKDEGMSSSYPSSSTCQWLMERPEFTVRGAKIGECIDVTDNQIQQLANQLKELESADEEMMKRLMENVNDDGCARLIPWDKTKRRKLIKMDENLLNELPSTSRDTATFNQPGFTQYALQYIHRMSVMASFHIRKNKNKSIWLNTRELEEEKCRNGVRKKEERERREKRKMERAEKEEEEEEKSDEYEVTDDDEEEELPTPNHSRKSNGAPKEKKKKKDTERKPSRKESIKGRRNSDCPLSGSRLSSVTSRPSHDGDMDYLIPAFNHVIWLEHFKKDNASNFTYNKIPVPECRRVEIEESEVENPEQLEEYTTENMMRRIAMQHHQLEDDERKRFSVNPRGQRASRVQRGTSRDQRGESQDSGRSRSTPSNRGVSEDGEAVPTPPPPPSVPSRVRGAPSHPPAPHFDYESIRPVTDYERLSIEPPYEKRTFSR